MHQLLLQTFPSHFLTDLGSNLHPSKPFNVVIKVIETLFTFHHPSGQALESRPTVRPNDKPKN